MAWVCYQLKRIDLAEKLNFQTLQVYRLRAPIFLFAYSPQKVRAGSGHMCKLHDEVKVYDNA